MYKLFLVFAGLSVGLAGCVSSHCSNCGGSSATLAGVNYDAPKDQTVLTLLPYGGITFPHRWWQIGYDETARSRAFSNGDSTHLHVSLLPFEKYSEVYQKGRTDQEHLAAFTKWETDYWRNEQRVTIDILQDSSTTRGYILGRAYDFQDHVDATFLFGTRRGLLYNFRGTSQRWSQQEMEVFLVGLFERN